NGGPTQTIALLPGSPALDHGNNALAVDSLGNLLTYDQRGTGFIRTFNGTVDIGAFEVQVPTQPPTITSASANPNPMTGTTTQLTAAATDPNGGNLIYTWSLLSGPPGSFASVPSGRVQSANQNGT